MHVENMTILKEIVLTPERKETWNSYNTLNMEEQDHRHPSTHSSDEDCRSPLNL